MSETGLFIALGVAALLAVAIYIFAWRASAAASSLLKGFVRVGIPAVVLIGAALAILLPSFQSEKRIAAPDSAPHLEYSPQKPKAPPRRRSRDTERADAKAAPKTVEDEPEMFGGSDGRSDGRSGPTSGAAPGGGSSAPIERGGAGRGLGVEREATSEEEVAESVAPPPVVTAEVPPPAPPALPPSPSPSLAPKAKPPEATTPETADATTDKTAWDIVPVFFGTDRQRADNALRLAYDGNRGRRLELGRALVSVPKSHQVPNIERPWALRIPYFNVTLYEEAEDPNKHFTMQEIKALSRDDFLKLVRARIAKSKLFKDQAFVFVHGFNTSFENGVYRTAQIAYDLKFDGAPFVYSWPSGGGVASYTYDRESSGQATPYLKEFMNLVIRESGAKAVSVIAHSMGNQPVLRVLKDLKAATPDGVIISQVILAAPDVDRDNFENIAKEILGLAQGITLYVAANDQALQFSRRFHGGVPRAGDVPARGPVVIEGIDTIDITSASTDSLGINHSGYAENNALLKDIERVIATGAAPQNRHPPKFERINQGQGAYWKYPTAP